MFNIFFYYSTKIKIVIFQYIKYDYWYLKILIQIYQNIYSEHFITLPSTSLLVLAGWPNTDQESTGHTELVIHVVWM